MTTSPPPPRFAPPVTPFLASSISQQPADGGWLLANPMAAGWSAALFGVPLDMTESFRAGTGEGPAAIRRMSDALETYSPALDADLEDFRFVDLGDVELAAGMEGSLDAVQAAARYAGSIAGLAVAIGGEHTLSLGCYRGIKQVYPDATLVHVDAHPDFREAYAGNRVSHASWLFHAGAEHGFAQLFLFGIRSADRAEWARARSAVAWCSPDLVLPPAVREQLNDGPVYLSIDIDVLDPSAAPGTGCPEPGGPTFADLMAFLYQFRGLRVVGMDVTEVSPATDPAGITAIAAAKLVREAVLLFGRPKG